MVGAVITRLVHSVAGERSSVALPRPRVSAPPIPADVQPNGVALPSFITAAADFYRVDTALTVPQLGHRDWRLRIHGMVDREVTYSFEDLAGFEVVEMVMTLTCVSNPVGGNLISTGVWTGYRVADLLAAAHVHPDADMVLSTSIDGFTAGTPVEALTDWPQRAPSGRPQRSAAADRAWLPGPAGSPWALRVCVGHQVGHRHGADSLRQSRGVLDAAWAGHRKHPSRPSRASTCQKEVRNCRGVPWFSVVSRGHRIVACGSWRSASTTGCGSPPNWARAIPTRPGDCGASIGRRKALGNTPSPCAPPTTPELPRPQIRPSTVPDGATGWHTVDFTVAQT